MSRGQFLAAYLAQWQAFRSLWLCIHSCPCFIGIKTIKMSLHGFRYSMVAMHMDGSEDELHHALSAQLTFISELYLFVKNIKIGYLCTFYNTFIKRLYLSWGIFFLCWWYYIPNRGVPVLNRLLSLGKKKKYKEIFPVGKTPTHTKVNNNN